MPSRSSTCGPPWRTSSPSTRSATRTRCSCGRRRRRQSIGMLARLIDYSLRPGVAALAWLAFTVDDGKAFHVPTRLRVQSVPGQNETPQTFETIEQIDADARLNRLRALAAAVWRQPTRDRVDDGAGGPRPSGARCRRWCCCRRPRARVRGGAGWEDRRAHGERAKRGGGPDHARVDQPGQGRLGCPRSAHRGRAPVPALRSHGAGGDDAPGH